MRQSHQLCLVLQAESQRLVLMAACPNNPCTPCLQAEHLTPWGQELVLLQGVLQGVLLLLVAPHRPSW